MYKKLEYVCFLETFDQNFDVEVWLKQRQWYDENALYVSVWVDGLEWPHRQGHEIHRIVN